METTKGATGTAVMKVAPCAGIGLPTLPTEGKTPTLIEAAPAVAVDPAYDMLLAVKLEVEVEGHIGSVGEVDAPLGSVKLTP